MPKNSKMRKAFRYEALEDRTLLAGVPEVSADAYELIGEGNIEISRDPNDSSLIGFRGDGSNGIVIDLDKLPTEIDSIKIESFFDIEIVGDRDLEMLNILGANSLDVKSDFASFGQLFFIGETVDFGGAARFMADIAQSDTASISIDGEMPALVRLEGDQLAFESLSGFENSSIIADTEVLELMTDGSASPVNLNMLSVEDPIVLFRFDVEGGAISGLDRQDRYFIDSTAEIEYEVVSTDDVNSVSFDVELDELPVEADGAFDISWEFDEYDEATLVITSDGATSLTVDTDKLPEFVSHVKIDTFDSVDIVGERDLKLLNVLSVGSLNVEADFLDGGRLFGGDVDRINLSGALPDSIDLKGDTVWLTSELGYGSVDSLRAKVDTLLIYADVDESPLNLTMLATGNTQVLGTSFTPIGTGAGINNWAIIVDSLGQSDADAQIFRDNLIAIKAPDTLIENDGTDTPVDPAVDDEIITDPIDGSDIEIPQGDLTEDNSNFVDWLDLLRSAVFLDGDFNELDESLKEEYINSVFAPSEAETESLGEVVETRADGSSVVVFDISRQNRHGFSANVVEDQGTYSQLQKETLSGTVAIVDVENLDAGIQIIEFSDLVDSDIEEIPSLEMEESILFPVSPSVSDELELLGLDSENEPSGNIADSLAMLIEQSKSTAGSLSLHMLTKIADEFTPGERVGLIVDTRGPLKKDLDDLHLI